jgi:hypothetical protein
MSELDRALEDCLARMGRGESINSCLEQYPEHAERLRLLLRAAASVRELQALQPSPEFRSEGRARLQAHMSGHPRGQAVAAAAPIALPSWWSRLREALRSFDRRLAYGMATLALIFLTAFTAAAQAALPGDALYGWKVASERVWWVFQADKTAADLALLDRRVAELVEVAGDAALLAQARAAYQRTLAQALAGATARERAEMAVALRDHWRALAAAGVSVPLLDDVLADEGLLPDPSARPPVEVPVPAGTAIPLEITTTPTAPTLPPAVTATIELNLTVEGATDDLVLPTATVPGTLLPPTLLPTATVPELLPTATLVEPLATLLPDPLLTFTPTLELPSP